MHRLLLVASFALLAVGLAGCGGSPKKFNLPVDSSVRPYTPPEVPEATTPAPAEPGETPVADPAGDAPQAEPAPVVQP